MGKIKKILENELVGGTQTADVYPVTSVKAVYDENNERLDNILNRRGVVNISTNYNADHIAEVLTLEQAIAKVPSKDRVLGFQGKFLSEDGWKSYVFIGDSIADWTNKTKWNNYLTGTDVVQESGKAEDKVMSQKAVSDKLDETKKVLGEEISKIIPKDNDGVCYQYDNFLDNNNLVGDICLNKRLVTNNCALIDASGYSCIVLENVEGQKYLNVRCTPSIYVPGVVMLDQKLNYDGDRNIIKQIFTSESLHDLQTITKMVEIPNGVKCIIVQANNGNGTETTLEEAKKLLAASFSSDKIVPKTELKKLINTINGKKLFYILDSDNNIIASVDKDGDFNFEKGVPSQIKKEIEEKTKDKFSKESAFNKALFYLLDDDGCILAAFYKHYTYIGNKIENEYLNEKLAEIKNNWKNKTIVWYGTSIPAAGYWNINNKNSYPLMVGSQLNANVVNEAVGSSTAASYITTTIKGSTSYEIISRSMGNSIKQNMSIFNACYNIDDKNKTASMKGESVSWNALNEDGEDIGKTIEINKIPKISSYDDAQRLRYEILSNSYEIKLLAKYLLSDKVVHDKFLKDRIGDLYENIMEYSSKHTNTDFNYKGFVDLFVLDHGHNDSVYNITEESNIHSYYGAMNKYIMLIKKYSPNSKICIISDYDNSNVTLISTQKEISKRFAIPFLDISNILSFRGGEPKVETCGYWDSNSIWHDTGFTWNEGAGTVNGATNNNCNAYLNTDNTVETLKKNMNPHKDEFGVWCWDALEKYIKMKDGLHPHSDASGRALKNYADACSNFISRL